MRSAHHPALLMILIPFLAAPAPQSTQEYELQWNLPHDRAAVFEVFDSTNGAKRNPIWLLACELRNRVGVTDGNDLPLRFLFRTPKQKVKVGSRWDVREYVFADALVIHPGVSPVEVVGTYRLKAVQTLKLEDHLRVALKDRKEKPEPVSCAIIEGSFQLFRGNWVNWKAVTAELKPSATLSTLLWIRTSDGAIMGGRYQFSGRTETYTGAWSGPAVTKATETMELAFRDPLIELNKAGLKTRIDNAIELGVKWLRAQQGGDGCITDRQGFGVGTSFGAGPTALALLALIHSGVSADDPAIRKGFHYLRSKKINLSYDLALYLMALEGKYLPLGTFEEVVSFSEEKARAEIAKKVTKEDLDVATSAAQKLIETQGENGAFGYAKSGDYPNLSSTQYAILGLKSASRLGVSIPPVVWKRALSYLEASAVSGGKEIHLKCENRGGIVSQERSNIWGWGYLHPAYPPPTGTMTAAALAVLAVSSSELARSGDWKDRDSRNFHNWSIGALAWLSENYSMRSGTPEGCGYGAAMPFYYLYGLERAFLLHDAIKLGDHDWYHEGAAVIISWQRTDGRWEGPHGTPVLDSAFSLLFLKRATLPVDTPRTKIATGDNVKKDSPKD